MFCITACSVSMMHGAENNAPKKIPSLVATSITTLLTNLMTPNLYANLNNINWSSIGTDVLETIVTTSVPNQETNSNTTLLQYAAYLGDIKAIEKIISINNQEGTPQSGTPLVDSIAAITDEDGHSPLHYLAITKNGELSKQNFMHIINLLLNNGAELIAKDSELQAALGTAIRYHNFSLADILLERGATLDNERIKITHHNNIITILSVVDLALYEDNTSALRYLLNHNAPLTNAVEFIMAPNNDINLINNLLNAGWSPIVGVIPDYLPPIDENHTWYRLEGVQPSCLIFALKKKNGEFPLTDLVKILVEHHPELIDQAIRFSIIMHNYDALTTLLSTYPRKVNDPTLDLINYAARLKDYAALHTILRSGAHIRSNDFGPIYNAFLGATADQNNVIFNIVRLLIDHGVSIDAVDNANETPLHYAAWYSNTNLIQLLINNGASINAVDRDHRTPLDMVTLGNQPPPDSDIARRILISNGALLYSELEARRRLRPRK